MITIISGTNRAGSKTLKVARAYKAILDEKGIDNMLFPMTELPADLVSPTMYNDRPASWMTLQEKYLNPAEKFIFVFPEYNGAFPGILKLMIDVSDLAAGWNGKKACMTGVSSGRAGCIRGMDAMTNMLHYIKVHVLPNKLPLSQIHTLLDDDGNLSHEETKELMTAQIEQLLKF